MKIASTTKEKYNYIHNNFLLKTDTEAHNMNMQYLSEYGLKRSISVRLCTMYDRTIKRVVRRKLSPSLLDVSRNSGLISFESVNVINSFCMQNSLPIEKLRNEFSSLVSELECRYKETELPFPLSFAAGYSSSFLVYSLVRMRKPQHILETGVANGHSTFFILHALQKNGSGTLTSFDISQKAGVLLEKDEIRDWNFISLKNNYKRYFHTSISRLPPLDLFIHDSDHSYNWQKFEYDSAYLKMSDKSLFMSDDIDTSYAFIDFCKKIDRKPIVLVEPTKMFGVLEINNT